jgi:PAS domain-containing protein
MQIGQNRSDKVLATPQMCQTRSYQMPSSFTPQLNPAEFSALLNALEECQVFQTDPYGIITRWISGPPLGASHSSSSASEEDLLDRHFSLFFTARDRDRGWPDRMLEWVRTASHVKDEGWRLRAGEERFWGEHALSVIREAAGETVGIMHIIFDASRRLSAERALHEADRRILEYQQVAELGTFEVDPSTGDFLVTPETLRLMEIAAPLSHTADFIPISSRELFQHIHPDDNARLYFAPQSLHPVRIRIRVVKCDGGLRHVELRSQPVMDREGVVVRRMGTLQDVTALVERA